MSMVGTTAYRIQGDGEPIVFIHGVGMNKDVWTLQASTFVSSHRVIVYDMLGHGGSALPPENATLADYCYQLAALLDALGVGAANVVGHSMGALVATSFALRYPERVLRLIAMNAVYARTAEQRAMVEARAATLFQTGLAKTLDGTITRWFGAHPDAALAEKAASVRRWLESVDPIGYARTYRLFATSDDAFKAISSGA